MPASPASVRRWVTDEEWAEAEHFAAARRREWLGWRARVRQVASGGRRPPSLPALEYDAAGVPRFAGWEGAMSVTHSAGYVGVALTSRPRCGIDLERTDRSFASVVSRFLCERERCMLTRPDHTVAAWCAKEALCKCLGVKGLSWDALPILSVAERSLRLGAAGREWEVFLVRRDGFLLAWVTD